jgi:threonine/homoserine/homoserine lactone efflux protein
VSPVLNNCDTGGYLQSSRRWFVVFVIYGASASLTRDCAITRPSVPMRIRRIYAGAFGFLGVKLAFSKITLSDT